MFDFLGSRKKNLNYGLKHALKSQKNLCLSPYYEIIGLLIHN